jgi:cytosine/adenosine deaminase-related metal-dependent hydrolase
VTLTVRNATALLMNERDEVLPDAELIAEEGRIVEIRAASRIRRRSSKNVVDASGCILAPGFIDASVRSTLSLSAHQQLLEPRFSQSPEIAALVEALQSPSVNAASADFTWLSLLKSGVTTAVDVSPFRAINQVFSSAEVAGIRLVAGAICDDQRHGVPRAIRLSTDEVLAQAQAAHNRWRGQHERLLTFSVAMSNLSDCSIALLDRLAVFVSETDVLAQVEIGKSPEWCERQRRVHQLDATSLLERHRLLSSHLLLLDATWLSSDEYRLAKHFRPGIVTSPSKLLLSANSASKFAERMSDSINLCLGSSPWRPSQCANMFRELQVVSLLVSSLPASPSSTALIGLATTQPAACLRRVAKIGRLEPGYCADFIVLEQTNFQRAVSLQDAAQAVLSSHPSQVRDVAVGGSWVIRNGKALTFDEQAVVHHAAAKSTEVQAILDEF